MAGHARVAGGDLCWRASCDPVVDLAGAVRDPAGGRGAELDSADGRVVPQEPVAAARHDEGNAHLGVSLHQVEHDAFLVKPAVGVLAQAEELLALIGGEALFDVVIAVAGGGEIAGAWPPEVDRLLAEQLVTSVAPHEADAPDSICLRGQRADGDPCALSIYLDDRLRGRSLAKGTLALDQIVEAGSALAGRQDPTLRCGPRRDRSARRVLRRYR